jgi:glycerophosphoryl diester phosphodiesterase
MVDGMLVLAHRGANRLAPENTVPAMREAVDRGADGVELDVHRTADGALVVRHDAEPDAPRAAYPESPILAEVLDVCRGRLVNVEIKDPGATEDVVTLLADRGDDDVLVSAFDWDVVDRVRELAPHLPTGLVSSRVAPEEMLARAVERGHTAVHPKVRLLRRIDVDGFVGRAHDQGVQVNVWTVNDVAQVEMLRDAGVDAIITDDEHLYRYGTTTLRQSGA